MFKIGDEVMDKDGNPYVVMGVGFGTYELRTPDGNMTSGMLEVWLAKYDPLLASALVKIAEHIAPEVSYLRPIVFEKVRAVTATPAPV